jgi:integrase
MTDLKGLKPGRQKWLERGLFVRMTANGLKYGISFRSGRTRVQEMIGPSKTDARKMLSIRKAEVIQGRYFRRSRRSVPTFKEFGREYLADLKPLRSTKSWNRDDLSVKAACEVFGKLRLYQIGRSHIEKFRSIRAGKVKPRTVNRDLSVVKRMLNLAVEKYKYIDQNPASKTEMVKAAPTEKRVLSYEEEQTLIDAAAPHLKPILRVGFDVGFRISDLLALEWHQVDFEKKEITAKNSKSNKIQRIRMTQQVEETLRSLPRRDGPVFLFEGKPIQSIKTAFAGAVRRAEIRHATPHDMRRTFATRLHNENVPIAKIRDLLGHVDVKTTMIYIGVLAEDLDAAMDVLDGARRQYWRDRGVIPLRDGAAEVPQGGEKTAGSDSQ